MPIFLIASVHRSRSSLLTDVMTMVGFGLLLRVLISYPEDGAELGDDVSLWIMSGLDEDIDDADVCRMGSVVVLVVVVVVDIVLLVVILVAEDEDEDVVSCGLERLPPKERRFRRRGIVLDVPDDVRDGFTGAVSPTKKSALICALICSLRSRISFVTTGFCADCCCCCCCCLFLSKAAVDKWGRDNTGDAGGDKLISSPSNSRRTLSAT